ncbi:MAG: DNA repair protein RadC [Holosporales bacterium]|nr:DNA repair protein RadC [Holosporales bacterium]
MQKVCEKFLNFGQETLYEYEIIELMLFLIFKNRNIKSISKNLIKKFETIDRILNASKPDLMNVDGIEENEANAIKIINGVVKATLKSRIMKRNHLDCFEDVINYCKINMKNLISEELRVIFLNAMNEVIADEILQNGDIDSVNICPRTVVKRCLEVGAKGLILVHNHPSRDPTPSANDVYITGKIISALDVFEISLHDHIIIGGDRFISFKALDLLND